METKLFKTAGIVAAVGFGFGVGVHQEAQGQIKVAQPPVSTTWVGRLVVGKKETGDAIAGN